MTFEMTIVTHKLKALLTKENFYFDLQLIT